jgi:7-keto-8-aminopelargonate synthetase-like enzyme
MKVVVSTTTDGVFYGWSVVAYKTQDLADKYDAMVMADECHAAGFIGATGKVRLKQRSNGKSRYYYRNPGKSFRWPWEDTLQPKKR